MGAASRQHLSPSSKAMNPLASIAALFTLSFIEMWCAIAYCVQLDDVNKDCEDKWAFAVVLGLFSALVCVGFGLMIKFKPAMANGMVGMIMAGLLFAWWVAGVAVSTFDLPFAPGSSENTSGTYANIAGNGYFAVWGAVIASGSLLVSLIPAAQAAAAQGAGAGMNEKFIFMVAFASVIELWHSAKLCDDLVTQNLREHARMGYCCWGHLHLDHDCLAARHEVRAIACRPYQVCGCRTRRMVARSDCHSHHAKW